MGFIINKLLVRSLGSSLSHFSRRIQQTLSNDRPFHLRMGTCGDCVIAVYKREIPRRTPARLLKYVEVTLRHVTEAGWKCRDSSDIAGKLQP